MNHIMIIGTNPPCPRCGLLTRVVTEKITLMGIDAKVIHVNYTDKVAADFAKVLCMEAGTAKDVAQKTGIAMDVVRVKELIENSNPDPDCEYKDYNDYNWSGELDAYLKPFEIKARDAGILMTPVLIINGELKHNGSIPGLKQINKWLSELE